MGGGDVWRIEEGRVMIEEVAIHRLLIAEWRKAFHSAWLGLRGGDWGLEIVVT